MDPLQLEQRVCESKARFRTKAEAKVRAARWRRDGVRYFVYSCANCLGFHLTHVAPEEFRARARR